MAGKFEIYTDAAGKHRFRLKAGNGDHRDRRSLRIEGQRQERRRVGEAETRPTPLWST